jgi:hypothetical protein
MEHPHFFEQDDGDTTAFSLADFSASGPAGGLVI